MSKEWFIHSDSIVSGPYTTDQVQEDLGKERWQMTDLIWWKGQREWMPIGNWKSQLSNMTKIETEKTQSPVWYLDVGGIPIGPVTQKEMFANLKTVKNFATVRLWTLGMTKWTNLFELHEIMEELGLTRRENERAPLLGVVSISRGDESFVSSSKAASISIGGMGLNEAGFLSRGEHIELLIQSDEFPYPLRLKGDVAYITNQGYAGIRFESLSSELNGVIFDYVRRFNRPSEAEEKNAA